MEVIYDNDEMCTQSEVINRDRVERIVEIYDTGEYQDQDFRTDTNTQQPVQWKGNDDHFCVLIKCTAIVVENCTSVLLYL